MSAAAIYIRLFLFGTCLITVTFLLKYDQSYWSSVAFFGGAKTRSGNSSNTKQKVLLLPQNVTAGITHHHKHIFLDGIVNSDKLELTNNVCDPDAIWFVSLTRVETIEWEALWEKQQQQQIMTSSSSSCTVTAKKVILVDWSDKGEYFDHQGGGATSRLFFLCSLYFGKDKLRYVTRQYFDGRDVEVESSLVNDEKEARLPFKELGTVRNDLSSIQLGLGGKVQVARYGVRTDVVDIIESMMLLYAMQKKDPTTTITEEKIYALHRSKDVASFWSPEDVIDPVSGSRSSLRAAVSKAVSSLAVGENLTVTTELRGDRARKGRLGVHEDYIMALLEHKIVVTAQRDFYEDHYRLMEALAGGALVFTDPMHPLPYKLKDGENVIVYDSISDLKEKICYYINDPEGQRKRLQIASRGYEVVMNYHRSWHVMERLILER